MGLRYSEYDLGPLFSSRYLRRAIDLCRFQLTVCRKV
jgi:hypothetical protein